MKRLVFAFVALALCGGWQIGSPVAPPSYTAPGDYASFTAWWGLRAYTAAIAAAGTQPVMDLRRASDNATCTAIVATDGSVDLTVGTPCNGNTQTVTAWIGASSALVSKLYDQTNGNACGGSSCDLVQATAGRQPTLILNCNGTLPCLRSVNSSLGAGARSLSAASTFTPTGSSISMSAVANRASGTQFSCQWVVVNPHVGLGNRIACISATQWNSCTTACILQTVVNASWHAANASHINNPGTSVLNVDGTETTSTTPNLDTTVAAPFIKFADDFATLTAEWAESGFQNSAAWSGATRTNLCHNQRIYWSTGGSC